MAELDRKELDRMATILTEVENPDIYAKDEKHINKPISNIKFGHILNINWDNILNTFRIIQKFFKETVLNQDVATDNTANKIVKRNADKSIEVGDIYCDEIKTNIPAVSEFNSEIAFRDKDGVIKFCNNGELIQEFVKIEKLIKWKNIWSGTTNYQQINVTHEDVSKYNEISIAFRGYDSRIFTVNAPMDVWLKYNQLTMVQRGGEQADRDYDTYAVRVSNTSTGNRWGNRGKGAARDMIAIYVR